VNFNYVLGDTIKNVFSFENYYAELIGGFHEFGAIY